MFYLKIQSRAGKGWVTTCSAGDCTNMGCAPFFAVALALLMRSLTKGEAQAQKAYASARDVVSEVYANVRTVAAYSGEKHTNTL